MCQLIKEKFYLATPWASYSLLFEPITRGKLIVWTGTSSLPASEFKCLTLSRNQTAEQIRLNFGTFINKLEWTLFGKLSFDI